MELITTKIAMAMDMGVSGNLFGGRMLAILDESAGAYASQICDCPRVLTKKIEEVIFESPVKVGNLIKVYGEVEKIGKTSITLRLEARKLNVLSGQEKNVCSTKMVFVRIDEDGNPIPISEQVKTRYENRYQKYGRGLLTPEELMKETGKN
jgi:acyl-CoA thioesterase YciA